MDGLPPPLRCFDELHPAEKFLDDGVKTVTSVEQKKVEHIIEEVISDYKQLHSLPQPTLLREQHYQYLKKGLRHLSDAYEVHNARQTRSNATPPTRVTTGRRANTPAGQRQYAAPTSPLVTVTQSVQESRTPFTVLSSDVSVTFVCPSDSRTVCQFLSRCQSASGGFAGGPGQHAHLAPTYAAVNALCIIGTEEAYDIIDREKLLDFLMSVKQPDGSFVMHVGGEVDVRSAYCAASVASLTNIIVPKLFEDTPNWILRYSLSSGL
ncbi:Protein farnesyltransferase subunit beta [Liparis tanakae]|uniref:Protein farnesyltransferase subunit beta n=1 Tax=Liparis tanakae TaxID=230148 RepID=A0A4Z2FWZ4_9TELE|nr:Protein farnesyltransferase subunit beta [Liparis tanakae]